jgi:hypothetical protein
VELEKDLSERMRACRSVAKRNDAIDSTLFLVGVVASAVATIAVGTGSLTKEINATLAAISGIITTVLRTFRFEDRARWWWTKYYKFHQMVNALRHEGAAEKDISQEMSKFLIQHEKEWPSFGKPPSGITT